MTHLATTAISLVCLGLTWLGVRTLTRQARRILLGIRAKSWPYANARIKSTLIHKFSRKQKGRNVEVGYVYEVHGTSYEGNTIHPCYLGKMADYHAEATAWKLPEGGHVRVSYDPEQPSRSTLTTGFNPASLLPIIAGMFALLPPAGFATWYLIKLAGWQANFEVTTLPSY